MTTNSSTSWYFSRNGSPAYTSNTPTHAFYSRTYYKSVDFGREMIMTKLTERHKENEGIDLIIENPSDGLNNLLGVETQK